MIKTESKTTEIKRNVEFVYDYLKNFSNFSMMANDKIENFKSTEDKCSFTIKNMGDFGIKMLSRVPNERIVITNDRTIQMQCEGDNRVGRSSNDGDNGQKTNCKSGRYLS